MGASQSSYEDEYDENENGADEMENNEMPVKVHFHFSFISYRSVTRC